MKKCYETGDLVIRHGDPVLTLMPTMRSGKMDKYIPQVSTDMTKLVRILDTMFLNEFQIHDHVWRFHVTLQTVD